MTPWPGSEGHESGDHDEAGQSVTGQAQSHARARYSACAVFLKCSVRYWSQHRWSGVLLMLGMALGVAVVFAVDIANESARRAFSLSLDAVTGRTTHQMVAGENGIEESSYTELRTVMGFRHSAPIVEGVISVAGETFQLLGVDLFAEPTFRSSLSAGDYQDKAVAHSAGQSAGQSTGQANNNGAGSGSVFSVANRSSLAILDTGTMVLASATAERLGLRLWDSLAIAANGQAHQLKLIGLLDDDRQAAMESLVMVDISTAQELLAFHGRLSRIDLVIENPQDLQVIRRAFPSIEIVEAARQNQSLQQMTGAFHTNLLAMSMLALLVGAFLIYNTVTLSVLQRRQLFGLLRVAGVTRAELFSAIMLEAFCFAIVGTVAGLLLGLLLGNVLLTLVTRTINDLYFTLEVRRVNFGLISIAKAVLLGLGAALLAALAPSLEAAGSPPVTVLQRSAIEKRVASSVQWCCVAGLALMCGGALITWLSHSSLWAGFIALLFIVVGYSLLIPLMLLGLASLASISAALLQGIGGPLGQYPLRSLTASLSRTSVAIAALVVAVSTTAGVGIMIGSFRLSVDDWLGQSLSSDIYIGSADSITSVLPDSLLSEIEVINGVAGLRVARAVDIKTSEAPVGLLALQLRGKASSGLNLRKTGVGDFWQRFKTTDAVLISEPFAWKSGLGTGDTVMLRTDRGIVPFHIEGVFADYRAGKGLLVMDLEQFRRYWHDRDLSSIGVTLSTDLPDTTAIKSAMRGVLARHPEQLMLRSSREIKSASLDIFDRTFAIIHVLRLLTVGVAFVGILSALMALSLERGREFAVLRAIGITPAELRKLLYMQTGLMGIIAGLLALPLGYVMSRLLVSVINVRSFGWTMDFHVPVMVLLQTVLLAISAALIAGWYPSRQLSRMPPAVALRDQ